MSAPILHDITDTLSLLLVVSDDPAVVTKIFLALAASKVPVPAPILADQTLLAQIIRLVQSYQKVVGDDKTASEMLDQVERDARKLADEYNSAAKEMIGNSF